MISIGTPQKNAISLQLKRIVISYFLKDRGPRIRIRIRIESDAAPQLDMKIKAKFRKNALCFR
jgi:hypothetical protein